MTETTKTAGEVEILDRLAVDDGLGDALSQRYEEVVYTAWASNGDKLIWIQEADVEEPIRRRPDILVEVAP